MHSITRLMIHKGVVTQQELDDRIAEIRARPEEMR